MTEQARAAVGFETIEAVADRGYYSGEEIVACEQAGITVYLPKAHRQSDTTNPQADGEGSFGIWYAKINNADMFVCDVGEVLCGSKEGVIAVLCGMLRRVSQF
jgi:hypothetical protein